ncbi:MAG: hypothetical protein M1483_08300 [Actinobacteria bacterium]|jgi:phosphate transport system protein|nr:hypothetical protein [Actinomycetota bacterium]MCL6105606.1 hypothetical protein [Actinomycetota bacterium]
MDENGFLNQINKQMITLFALIGEGIVGATHTLLTAERDTAKTLAAQDEKVDILYKEIEQSVEDRLIELLNAPGSNPTGSNPTGSNPTGRRLKTLLTVLRMLPELERSGDLAEHIATKAARGIGAEMTARSRGIVEQMGEVTGKMWRLTTDAYVDRKPNAADKIDEIDDILDELHVSLTAELVNSKMPLPVAIELALIARFYERFGDHAVNLAKKIGELVN